MSGSIFVDTNVLVYFYTKTEPDKIDKLAPFLCSEELFISTQVLNELANVLHKKFKMQPPKIVAALKEISEQCSIILVDLQLILDAIEIMAQHKISYFDSVIVAAAIRAKCKILLSEDLNNGHIFYKNLKVINPFINQLS
jgi:predicted nucleic acid-binding protein